MIIIHLQLMEFLFHKLDGLFLLFCMFELLFESIFELFVAANEDWYGKNVRNKRSNKINNKNKTKKKPGVSRAGSGFFSYAFLNLRISSTLGLVLAGESRS